MAQIDPYQGAEGSADAQKRALLATIAAQGSAGQAAFNAQQQAAQQAAVQAAQGASQRSDVIDAPDALTSQLAASGQAVGATYGADAQAGANTLAAVTAAGQQANGNYFDQLRAAIPLSRQLTQAYQKDAEDQANRKLWDDTINRNQDTLHRQWDLEDRNYTTATRAEQHRWDLEDRQAALALAQQKVTNAGTADPLARLVKQLGGQTLAKTQLKTIVAKALEQASVQQNEPFHDPRVRTADNYRPGQIGTTTKVALSKDQKEAVVDGLGEQLGLPPGLLSAFLAGKPAKPAKQSKTLSPQMVSTLRSKPGYGHYANIINDEVTAARTRPDNAPKGWHAPDLGTVRKQVAATMRTSEAYKREPLLFEQLIRDYLGG